jgi:glycosyltransferase involved in cell wall biosynthesis
MSEANKITSEGEIRALVIIYPERSNFMSEANKITSEGEIRALVIIYPERSNFMSEANKITSEGEIRALVIIYLERSNFMSEANKINSTMKLSIIIPTLNEERYLGAMLENIRAKLTSYEYEIIVSDGGSWDKTLEIAKKYAITLKYEDVERKTISWQRNRGAQIARGNFLVFMDTSVNILEPNSFFRQALARFEKDPKLVALAPKIRIFPNKETFADVFFGAFFNYIFWLENNVLGIGAAPGKFQIIRADAFRKVGGYREDLVVAEDLDIFARLAKIGHTRIALNLTVYHSGRRIHTVGWLKLIWLWTKNFFSYTFFGYSITKDWYLYQRNLQKKSAKKRPERSDES